MARRRKRNGHEVDVFVVFSDISLSLAFILLVYSFYTGLSATKTVVEATRTVRQERVRDEIVNAWLAREPLLVSNQQLNPGQIETHSSETRPQLMNLYQSETKQTRSPAWYVYRPSTPGAIPVAVIRFNASYLRVSVYDPQFMEGATRMSPTSARDMLMDAALVAKAHYKKDLDYLEVHGLSDGNDDMGVSRERAIDFAEFLQQDGIVSTDPASDAIPLKFIECYGTGKLLYPDQNPNRVDLRLFFTDKDKSEEKEIG